MNINTGFPATYAVAQLIEMPTSPIVHYYYPGASTLGGKDGISIKVIPEKIQPWIGTFAFGGHKLSGVFSTPNVDRLCVVAAGAGYFVSSNDPMHWEKSAVFPITHVCMSLIHQVIVFSTFTEMLAYDASGVRWRIDRLSWDGFTITQVEDDFIHGKFFDIRDDAVRAFAVNIKTGAKSGAMEC